MMYNCRDSDVEGRRSKKIDDDRPSNVVIRPHTATHEASRRTPKLPLRRLVIAATMAIEAEETTASSSGDVNFKGKPTAELTDVSHSASWRWETCSRK